MCDEIIRDESSLNKNKNLKAQLSVVDECGGGGTNTDVVSLREVSRMYGSADTRTTNKLAKLSSHSNETSRRNLTQAFRSDESNASGSAATDDDGNNQPIKVVKHTNRPQTKPNTSRYPAAPVKYDFQNLSAALPFVLMPTATVAASTPVNAISTPSHGAYYTFNDPNSWPAANFAPETYSAAVPNADYFISNPVATSGNYDDYFYPIVRGTRNDRHQNQWSANPYADTSNLAVGYAAAAPYFNSGLDGGASSQQWALPYNVDNYYTSLQPNNFYVNVPPGIPPQFICKRDCTPTTRFPTTRCTRRPGSPQPIIAWENNNTCCCELCGIACKGQFNRVKGPQYGPCKPAPLPLPNNRNALYCHGRRRKREYYLSAPRARQRLQRESDRCRITTTTTPKPAAWPTSYPIKYRFQKSVDTNPNIQTIDTDIPIANQVSNMPMLMSGPPATPSHRPHPQLDKILVFENQRNANNKIQMARPAKMHNRSRSVPETTSSKLRMRNEVRMQGLQETLEIALKKMNQEMGE